MTTTKANVIPQYPEWVPISLALREALHPQLSMNPDGVSEYTFAGLYLFRNSYRYRISQISDTLPAISGISDGKRFFMLPCGLPEDEKIRESLFSEHDYLKGLSEPNTDLVRIQLENAGYAIEEDRDNFDYLYERNDLACLPGKPYHKKRNHVNAFINNYSYDEQPITKRNVDDALNVLEEWHRDHPGKSDYEAAREALELWQELDLKGYLVYVDDKPAAYTLGEPLAQGRSFVVHFEKAVGTYRGIYQFINRAFACILPQHYLHINREQDLGDEGLRQSKMTYRPSGFVKKYKVYRIKKE